MYDAQHAGETAVETTRGTASTYDASTATRRAEMSVERLASILGERASARAVFGEVVHGDGVSVIPVARAVWGMGGGSGEGMPADDATGEMGQRRRLGQGWGTGGGGGVVATPVGYIVLRQGEAEFRPITSMGRLLAAAAAGALVGAWMARRRRMRAS
jgi:uncharacterized spore protein YtfJ